MSTEEKKDPCSLLVWSGVQVSPWAGRLVSATSDAPASLLRVQDDGQGPDLDGAEVTPCLQDVKAANFRRRAVLACFVALLPLTLISLYRDRVRVKRRSVRQKERDERWRRREARLNAEAAQLGEDH